MPPKQKGHKAFFIPLRLISSLTHCHNIHGDFDQIFSRPFHNLYKFHGNSIIFINSCVSSLANLPEKAQNRNETIELQQKLLGYDVYVYKKRFGTPDYSLDY